jgi:hypothetical protein
MLCLNRARTLISSMILILVFFLQVPQANAVTLPSLKEGMTLKYEINFAWTAPNAFATDFTRKGNMTITILRVNQARDEVTIRVQLSYVVSFPASTVSSSVDAVNFGGEKGTVTTDGTTQQRSWSLDSTVVLRGRTPARIDGDKADTVTEYFIPSGKNTFQFNSHAITEFALGYPTRFFLDPKTSPGNTIRWFGVDWKNDIPTPKNTTFPIDRIDSRSTVLGDRKVLVSETIYQSGSGQAIWRTNDFRYWDVETGIFLEMRYVSTQQDTLSKITGTITLVQLST